MVRVISTHHFANQNVQVIEQPTASAIAHPDKLLLALSSHSIEVRNLKDHAEVLFTFPTVDEVTQIMHCLNGNFIATLESKFNRQNHEINFVRVYLNWDSLATMQQSKMTSSGVSLTTSECGMVQPMRARIAGRVTPTTNQSELGNLEMIEIPVKRNPQQINVCQISGNLIIQMNKSITIYTFEIKTHDISKLKFIDFEELPLTIDLCFYPREIHIAENYFACSNGDTFHMFKIVNKQQKEILIANELNSEYSFHYNNQDQDKPINYKQLLKNEALNMGKEKITVYLPTIMKENSIIHKYCPFTFCDKEIKAAIRFSPNIIDVKSFNYEIEDLVQLRLKPIVVECAQKQVTEEFKCLTLKPLYVKPNLLKARKNNDINNTLKSLHRNLLHSVACIITTQQEGYLYQFCDYDTSKSIDHCISIYPFTAPIYKIVLENHFLHALTETGLESYTLRIGHELCKHLEVIDNENSACPSVQESVCLMGLRPFLGVEEILISENHLLLLANSDSSPTHSVSSSGSSSTTTSAYWTLYDLELPSAKTVFNDISIVANSHRFSSSQTYCHLMNEGHVILRLNLVLNRWSFNENSNVNLAVIKESNSDDLVEAYRTSCALLADHYVMCLNKNDYSLCVPYYKMAKVYPLEVLNRIKKIQEQSNNNNIKGLLYYLKTILLDTKSSLEIEKLYIAGSKQNISEKIIELFEKHSLDDLPNLILKSNILRQYSTDKLISVLTKRTGDINTRNPEKSLALTLLYIQKCNNRRAEDVLAIILKEDLSKILKDNHELLFEVSVSAKSKSFTFSELSILLMGVYPKITSEIFVGLIVEKKVISFHKMLKIFLEYLPASIGTDTTTGREVLQKTLEMYFTSYFSKFDEIELNKLVLDWASSEGLKLLVRSYLSEVQIMQIKEKNTKKEVDIDKDINTQENDQDQEKPYFEEPKSNEKQKFLFSNFRYEYLDKMPPYQPEITSKLYQATLNKPIESENQPNPDADFVLKKLQAILCSPIANKHILVDLVVFLDMNENLRGHLSMLSIILLINEAISLLVEKCPQCLLQFGKDRFSKLDEWKHLIATIQNKIVRLSENKELQHVCFFYKKILKDVLTHVAMSMNLEQLLQVFPQKLKTKDAENTTKNSNVLECEPIINLDDIESLLKHSKADGNVLNEIQNYEPYITICKETMHANQIKKLITTTGQQLLCTLNL
nr:Hermansky-Pudlak syndrome 3 protein homolog [Onthophagus taurus]XP_022901999.1 Hermansky-Pudlak syndrome 3 protein homolog [Onthophagus taurus]XP_022902000.1 Hermansky-Pudlak syndrome 3 protein homolog [Onthophagus taurus]